MEDYEAQEQEFWAKLEEEEISRSAMLRRSAAAAVGLTILSGPATAFARSGGVDEAVTADGIPMKELIRRAKKEGHVNLIALPPDWANYGGVLKAWKKKYGIAYTDDNPNGSSAQENQAIRSLKGDKRAPDAVDVGPSFAIAGAAEGLYAKYKVAKFKTIPRGMKDGRGFWYGDYYGAVSIGYNANLVSPAPKTVASGQTPISIDWDYLNLGYRKEFPAANWHTVIPADGVYGAYYCQAINATAPHPWAARLWEEFLYSDMGQLLFLKGYSHPARFNDLAKHHKIPKKLLKALPSPALYAKIRFATAAQQTRAKALIASEW